MSSRPDDRNSRRRSNAAAATIRDVAAQAGVSVATVSRVLNDKDLVRAETSQQVLAAARSLRYVPNVAARSLSIRRSHTVGVVLPEVHGEFFSEVIRGIDLAARGSGYHILVSGSHSEPDEMMNVIEALRGRVDGMIIMAPGVRTPPLPEPLGLALPVVLLNASKGDHGTITIDNYGGARAMMRHLLDLGHTRIAFIKGPADNGDARERLRGYRQAVRSSGRETSCALEFAGDFTEAAGHAAARQILSVTPRPTAIFAANDSMAVGALFALIAAGIAVPRDLSVVGFDDIPIAHYVTPPLTTIRVDIAELGRRSFALLVSAIDAAGEPPTQECISTTLVVRESSAPPAAATMSSERSSQKKSAAE